MLRPFQEKAEKEVAEEEEKEEKEEKDPKAKDGKAKDGKNGKDGKDGKDGKKKWEKISDQWAPVASVPAPFFGPNGSAQIVRWRWTGES